MTQRTAQLEPKTAGVAALRAQAEHCRPRFSLLAQQWRRDTLHFSRISRKVAHPAYQQIIAMGEAVVPLILEALRDHPAHWFAALKTITGVDPIRAGSNPVLAREAWLEWGRTQGLVD